MWTSPPTKPLHPLQASLLFWGNRQLLPCGLCIDCSLCLKHSSSATPQFLPPLLQVCAWMLLHERGLQLIVCVSLHVLINIPWLCNVFIGQAGRGAFRKPLCCLCNSCKSKIFQNKNKQKLYPPALLIPLYSWSFSTAHLPHRDLLLCSFPARLLCQDRVCHKPTFWNTYHNIIL